MTQRQTDRQTETQRERETERQRGRERERWSDVITAVTFWSLLLFMMMSCLPTSMHTVYCGARTEGS